MPRKKRKVTKTKKAVPSKKGMLPDTSYHNVYQQGAKIQVWLWIGKVYMRVLEDTITNLSLEEAAAWVDSLSIDNPGNPNRNFINGLPEELSHYKEICFRY